MDSKMLDILKVSFPRLTWSGISYASFAVLSCQCGNKVTAVHPVDYTEAKTLWNFKNSGCDYIGRYL